MANTKEAWDIFFVKLKKILFIHRALLRSFLIGERVPKMRDLTDDQLIKIWSVTKSLSTKQAEFVRKVLTVRNYMLVQKPLEMGNLTLKFID